MLFCLMCWPVRLTYAFSDLSPQSELFNIALQYFSSDSEELRSAAAFAVGNIAIGNPNTFLPLILNVAQSNKDKQLLSLHALREVRV